MIGPSQNSEQSAAGRQIVLLQGAPPPLDMEFKPGVFSTAFRDVGLSIGRCFGSKSTYRRVNPRNVFIPNANIFCRLHGKVWWGDVDLREDQSALEKVAHRLRCRLYVVRESDGRFENAEVTYETVRRCAVWHTGGATLVPGVRGFLRRSGLGLTQVAQLTNVRRCRLTEPQPPDIALEVFRRLADFDELFQAVAADSGHRKWGDWWTAVHEKLEGESPMSVFTSGRLVPLGDLIDGKHFLRCFGLTLSLSKRL